MKTMLKIIGILVVVLLIVVGVGILALPQILSTDMAKTKISALIEQKTGRKLIITGDTSFKLYPDIGVSLNDISLSNPPSMKGAPLVKMAALRASLKLVPLFKGQVEVADITLIKPHFVLLVDKQGNRNWDFNMSASDTDTKNTKAKHRNNITLRSVTIKNGLLQYINAKDNIEQKFEAINISLAHKLPSREINAKGDLRWQNEKLNIVSKIHSPDKLNAGQSSQVFLKVTSRIVESEFEGLLKLGDQPSIDGKLISHAPSVRKLASFLGSELPPGTGFKSLKLKTDLKGNANNIEYATTQFLFDNMDLVAKGNINLKKSRPVMTADIETDRLDLSPYFDGGSSNETSGASDTPIDLSGLKAIDGIFSLKAKEIWVEKARLGQGDFTIALKNGVADATINSLSLYRGSATGKLVLDGRGSLPAVSGNLSLKDVLVGAILRDFAGFDKLAGKGSLSTDFNAKGNNTKNLKRSLKGALKINLARGRIDGFNLAKYVEDITGNTVPGSGTGRDGKERTSYDKMSATLKINNGIARNNDFLVTGSFFRVRAGGRIDLVNESLNLRVAPHLFSGDWSFSPPLRISGSWSKPRVGFDAVAFLGGGDAVVRSLRGAFRGESIAKSTLLKRRGLKTDKEIENYLAGKKIDPKPDQPVSENTPAGSSPETTQPSSPATGLLGGNQNGVGNLLKKVLP